MILICGLGQTGVSFLKHLKRQGLKGIAFDTRPDLDISHIRTQFPDVPVYLGELPHETLNTICKVWLSPGFYDPDLLLKLKSESTPFSSTALRSGLSSALAADSPSARVHSPGSAKAFGKGINSSFSLKLLSDIQVFREFAKAPIIAITGTNGKSTMTSLVSEMINAAGKKALMGGNIGIPVLDLLEQPVPDYYVLELSSFQLEYTPMLNAKIACILNITPDHLDRHDSMKAYVVAKEQIFNGAEFCVDGRKIAHSTDLALKITAPLNLPVKPQKKAIANFKPLTHRLENVGEYGGVLFINDSKATNVASTIYALEKTQEKHPARPIVLLLGGTGKGQDFSPLKSACEKYCDTVIVYGEAGGVISSAFNSSSSHVSESKVLRKRNAAGSDEAVNIGVSSVPPGGIVLLSPACASFDEFDSFVARGEWFKNTIEAKVGSSVFSAHGSGVTGSNTVGP